MQPAKRAGHSKYTASQQIYVKSMRARLPKLRMIRVRKHFASCIGVACREMSANQNTLILTALWIK